MFKWIGWSFIIAVMANFSILIAYFLKIFDEYDSFVYTCWDWGLWCLVFLLLLGISIVMDSD